MRGCNLVVAWTWVQWSFLFLNSQSRISILSYFTYPDSDCYWSSFCFQAQGNTGMGNTPRNLQDLLHCLQDREVIVNTVLCTCLALENINCWGNIESPILGEKNLKNPSYTSLNKLCNMQNPSHSEAWG